MRRGTHNPGAIIQADEFVGFCLGADYAAEHEWGINDLHHAFGTGEGKATKFPEVIHFEKNGRSFLVYSDTLTWRKDAAEVYAKHQELKAYNKEPIVGAWSRSDFAISVDKKIHGTQLLTLFEAMKTNDFTLKFARDMGLTDNHGLCLLINSKLTK